MTVIPEFMQEQEAKGTSKDTGITKELLRSQSLKYQLSQEPSTISVPPLYLSLPSSPSVCSDLNHTKLIA